MKTKDRSEAVHSTHDREAWKTAESCGMMESSYLKYKYGRLSLVRVWVTVGTCPQCCNGKTFRLPIKGYILYCKRFGLVGWLVSQLVESFSRSSVLQTIRLL